MSEIVAQGASPYQIVTPGRYFPVENHAAENLQEGLYRMTGVRLPVRWAHQRLPELPAILVGSRDAGEPGLWDKDAYEILPQGSDLVLRGENRRGTHYAVFAFLESLGAGFWGPDSVSFPHLDRVALPTVPVRSTAAFSYRHVFYPTAQVPEWAIRWKLNVHDGGDPRWGPNALAHSWGHSFEALVPVEEHFAAHPEYFALVDGRRRDILPQLCCTNPAVADAASESMARWIAAYPDRRIFSVSFNDWEGWCECPDCAEADRREGGHIGQVLTLVNRVAERFPDRIIATLAYWWAVDPPREMRARDNVLVVLCHNEGCFNHSLAGCELNDRFLQRLRGWKSRSSHILLWDYFVNYHSYLMPTPNLERIAQDIRLYHEAGVDGMFCQGSAVRGGQFEGLRQYLMARLLWDPGLSAWSLAEEWLAGAYGAQTGGSILEYLHMLHDHVRENHVHMPSFGAGQEIQEAIFTPEILAHGKALWDRAEANTAPEDRDKVFAARAPEMCSRLFHAGVTYSIQGATLAPQPKPDFELRDRFVRAAIMGHAAHLREDDAAPEAFQRNYGRTYEVVTLENPHLRAVVVPELGGRLYALRQQESGIELLQTIDMVRYVNYFPYGAGYEFSLLPEGARPGTREAYRLVEQEGTRAVVEALLPGEIALRNEYVLDGNRLLVRHQIQNRGQNVTTVAPATHPEWGLTAFGEEATVGLCRADGSWQRFTLNPEGRQSRDLEFTGADKPAGVWQLASSVHPLMFQETFDPEQVEHTRLMLSRRRGSVYLQLYFQPVDIAPGESVTLGTTWEFSA
jgi:hypothetical protein